MNASIIIGILVAVFVVFKLTRKSSEQEAPKAKVAEAAPVVAAPAPVVESNDDEIIAVIAAAVAAYGCSATQITHIAPTLPARTWTYTARMMTVNTRNQMF